MDAPTITDPQAFAALSDHANHYGVYIVQNGDVVEVRCCARTHGGDDHLLLAVRKE